MINFEMPRLFQFGSVLSAIAVGASHYFQINRPKHAWNRLDRHAPMQDQEDGSFPASDPPSTVPAA